MSTSEKQSPPQQIDEVEVQISTGDLTTLHKEENTKTNVPNEAGAQNALSNILDNNAEITSSENLADDEQEKRHILKVKVNKKDETEYHTDNEHDPNTIEIPTHQDTLKWFRMGTDRSVTPNTNVSDTPYSTSKHDLNYMPTPEEKYEEFVLHLRHAASYKAEFDIYQVLAYRAKVSYGQKVYFKPFKVLRGLVSEQWSDLEVRWLNSFQRVLSQAIVCFCIQTLGVTVILATQFSSYFDDQGDYAQCDYAAHRWKTDWHLKLLAFLWTAFIALGVSGWVYRARHSGFYPVLLFLKTDQKPNWVSIPILQIGLLTNYYVVSSSVIGSFILIYQTEGGTETIGMILQAVALFFILELDNKIVHARDFLSIRKYFDVYIKNNKHKKLPHSALNEKQNCMMRPLEKCKG
eukprot:933076_1